MTDYRTVDIPSFVARHVYEFYFNCDYDGPTWTGNLSRDLKIIAAMPVLYPEQLKDPDRNEGRQTSGALTPRLQEGIPDRVSVPQWVKARAA
jgi:hypothetical protein